jgi:hypothetical protein
VPPLRVRLERRGLRHSRYPASGTGAVEEFVGRIIILAGNVASATERADPWPGHLIEPAAFPIESPLWRPRARLRQTSPEAINGDILP